MSGSSDFLTTPCVLNCTKDEDVNGATSVWLGWSDAVLGLVSAITAGAFGSMSDSPRWGRTPVMFLSTVGLLASIGMNVLADVLDLPPLFLVLSNVVNGFTGGYAVFLAMVFAYAADVTKASEDRQEPDVRKLPVSDTVDSSSSSSEEKKSGRASSFSLVESMLYLGNILGPLGMSRILASGRQSRDGGVLLGLYTEAGLGFVLFLYIGLVLPESLPRRDSGGRG